MMQDIPFRGWTFYDYFEGGTNCLEAWIASLSMSVKDNVRSKLNSMLIPLQQMPPGKWPEQWISAYKGRDDIYELKFRLKRVQFRPFGCYGPGRYGFTLLGGAIEQGDMISEGVLTTLEARMRSVTMRTVQEHRYD